jgi:ABC-2 type transport system ATP-binding protein
VSVDDRSGRPVIELRGAGKQYTKYEDAPMLLNRILSYRPGQTRRSKLWAIRGVDLQVEAGETVGVIGRNGSGKSTMLRMLAGVTAPSEGMVAARGRVAPLIAVGVGFHPELTGRENVYVNGTILGLARAEIERKLDDILSFAEIDDFIDTPVKFYSSGMFVRLGFAVAVAARPDILLIDEVLAVGDYAFQAKCYERMDEMRAEGATVLVVSHNLNVVRNLCARTLLLHDGAPVYMGDTDEALSRYHGLLDEHAEADEHGAPVVDVRVELRDTAGAATNHVSAGDEVTFRISARAVRRIDAPRFYVMIERAGSVVYTDSDFIGGGGHAAEPGEQLCCDVRLTARFPTGSYSVLGGVIWGEAPHDRRPSRAVDFYVSGRRLVQGLADLEATFSRRLDPAVEEPQGGGSFHGA